MTLDVVLFPLLLTGIGRQVVPQYINTAFDLITSREAICQGFLSQAEDKTRKANPYIEKAAEFWRKLQNAPDIATMLESIELKDDLIKAAGFSQKARNRLADNELNMALKKVLETIAHKTQNTDFDIHEEILYRYLLTMGDALGGEMRNFTGAKAGAVFAKAILNSIDSDTVKIRPSPNGKIQKIQWSNRLILFDKKPKLIDKSIDVILLDNSLELLEKELLNNREFYLACGELKGGIDPAGADEHWKTAKTALGRIRNCFQPMSCPHLFFVGAAIEPAMAEEIFADLNSGQLTHAANFTIPQQVEDLASWLISL